MKELYLSHISPWAPGLLDDKENWQKWTKGESDVQIEQTKDSPKLEYTDPLFRRRLSQISKMTMHKIQILLIKKQKLFFVRCVAKLNENLQ